MIKSILPKKLTGRIILISMLAFFGVIFAVNGTFLYFAISTWPDLVSDEAYQEGLNYNQTLDQAQLQSDLGWTSQLQSNNQSIKVNLSDKSGNPLSGITIKAIIKRPVEDITPIIVILSEDDQYPGQYSAAVKFPLPGRWYVKIDGTQSDEIVYRMEYEIMVAE
jgi:nitrogen fixation protein FixH